MKKTLAILLALCMVCSLSVSAWADDAVFANPGTYTASAAGRNGDVTLTVEVTSDAIVSIEVENEETPTIGGAALETLTEEVIGSQSIAVDAVAGATMSSNAFISALQSCVEQAGGDLSKLSGEVVVEMNDYAMTDADVVVVGAGGAGLMAAITAANDGASVILIEKSSSIGGNTLCAANGINAFDSDVQLADEAYQAADTSFENFEALQTNESSRLNLVDAFISNSAEAINYLSSLGVDFTVEISNDERNSSQNYYLMKAEQDGSTMLTVVNALSTALDNSTVTLYKNTEATSLVQDENGVVTGVVCTTDAGDEITFSGKSIVLCTGGFGKNPELVAEVNPDLKGAITDEQAPTTGQGLLMAQAIGADAVDLGNIQTFPSVIDGSGMFMSFGLWMSGNAISVNNNGERYALEQFENSPAILAQDGGLVYGIFDESNYSDNYASLIEKGFMVEADSVAELADALGIPAENLQATIDQWNADAEATGTDSLFGRENITTISTDGKLYGYEYGVGAHYFMGGILINENTQVLDTDGNVIDGLYAAGEVTGGFHGTQRVDGSGTGDSIVFGMLAGHVTAAAAAE